MYASPVLDHLDPTNKMFSGRLYRQHCSYHPNLGVFAKDVCDVLRMQKARADDETPNGANENILPCDERRVVLVSEK